MTVRVEYVGAKARGVKDNVGGTGIRWAHPGDVQSVPDLAWPMLAEHPDVWRLVDAEGGDEGHFDDPLEEKTLDELRTLCRAQGIDFRANAREASLIAKLRGMPGTGA